MKIFCLINAICFLSLFAQAQNTFPTSGNVGIGTTTPSVKFEVFNAAAVNDPIARFGSSTSTNTHSIWVWNGTSTYTKVFICGVSNAFFNGTTAGDGGVHVTSGKSLFLGDGSGTAAMVLKGGNVGIGTTSPNNKLQIADGADDGTQYGSAQIIRATNPGDNRFHLSFIRSGQMVSGIGYVSGTNTLGIWTGVNTAATPLISFLQNQTVGILTTNPGPYALAVEGTLGARKIKVTQANPWADYVFDSSYDLKSLSEVEQFIKDNKHLPEVPTAAEVKKDGIDLGDSQATLLKKIEELTLYMIEQKKEVDTLKKVVNEQSQKLNNLEKTNNKQTKNSQ